MLRVLLGAIRVALLFLMILVCLPPILLFALAPIRFRGVRLSGWVATGMARFFNLIFNVRFRCDHPERLFRHHGLIFPNHSGYLDVVSLLTIMPVRFLAAAEVQRRPLIGWLAGGLETVFVDRSDKMSRRAARHSISAVLRRDPYPPVLIFPEGKLGPGDHLLPFRHGAFALAQENKVSYLPCALRYDHVDIVTWYGGTRNESLMTAVWRFARFPGPVHVEVILLEPVQPKPEDDPAQLAVDAQRAVEAALGFPESPTT